MALLSLILALALSLTEVLLPVFDRVVGKPIALHYLSDWPLLLALVGLALATGLIAGAYPAAILSGLRPASALRTNASRPIRLKPGAHLPGGDAVRDFDRAGHRRPGGVRADLVRARHRSGPGPGRHGGDRCQQHDRDHPAKPGSRARRRSGSQRRDPVERLSLHRLAQQRFGRSTRAARRGPSGPAYRQPGFLFGLPHPALERASAFGIPCRGCGRS